MLIGRGVDDAEKNTIKALSQRLEISDDVIFAGYLDRQKLRDFLSYSDITISAIPPAPHYIISSPTKIYESIGNGVPVVANFEILEQQKVLKASGAGMLVKYDTNEFSKAILDLLNNPKKAREMGKKGKKYIMENYTYEVIARKVEAFFM